MLQRFIISLMKVITNTFFRRIDVVGEENIPEAGPVIFAGNHPNALMDGWLLSARCGRWPLHFMADSKLWDYPLLGRFLDAMGAVPIFRRERHAADVDNTIAFEKLFEVLEAGNCMGIFPEGVSHTESQLTKFKTGTARIALSVAARGHAKVTIVPCGLNYIHRDRFRSQVLIEFGEAIHIDAEWISRFEGDDRATVLALTEYLADSLKAVTLNAPDWGTLRFIQTARRLYKPATAHLSPSTYMELNRRFIDTYQAASGEPEMIAFREELDNYQARLDALGLKDYQLRKSISVGHAFRRLMGHSLLLLLLVPIAIPGIILHLPVAWLAVIVGDKFSYEVDDVATLKVLAVVAILPILYVIAAFMIGNYFGIGWAIFAVIALSISFSASVWVIEAQATLLTSLFSILRRTRLRAEIDDLQATRLRLVAAVRTLADKLADPSKPRLFSNQDFAITDVIESDQ
jgi:1-acyl-sn-glycerol-3-phosphate acyltransferase